MGSWLPLLVPVPILVPVLVLATGRSGGAPGRKGLSPAAWLPAACVRSVLVRCAVALRGRVAFEGGQAGWPVLPAWCCSECFGLEASWLECC